MLWLSFIGPKMWCWGPAQITARECFTGRCAKVRKRRSNPVGGHPPAFVADSGAFSPSQQETSICALPAALERALTATRGKLPECCQNIVPPRVLEVIPCGETGEIQIYAHRSRSKLLKSSSGNRGRHKGGQFWLTWARTLAKLGPELAERGPNLRLLNQLFRNLGIPAGRLRVRPLHGNRTRPLQTRT